MKNTLICWKRNKFFIFNNIDDLLFIQNIFLSIYILKIEIQEPEVFLWKTTQDFGIKKLQNYNHRLNSTIKKTDRQDYFNMELQPNGIP